MPGTARYRPQPLSRRPKEQYQNREGLLEIREKIKGFIVENFLFGTDDASLGDDNSFLESGIIDSTGVLEVVGFIEDEFGIEVLDEELVPDNFDSLSKLTAYVAKKKG
jgi:acyl carrier protein